MWDRTERVEALMKERIATIVLERLSDPRLGFITITGVKLSGDKRLAKVAFTVLGSAAQRRTTERALRDAASHVQQVLAPSMRMRNMPELRFVYDESIEKESKMLELLDGLQAERGEHGDDGAEGGASDNVGQPAAPDDDDDVIDEPS